MPLYRVAGFFLEPLLKFMMQHTGGLIEIATPLNIT